LSQNILFNGVVYVIPSNGDDSWGQDLTDFFIAIPQGVLQKSGGNFTLSSDINFGANFGLLSKYFSTRTLLPASAGLLRLALSDTIAWRNNANTADLELSVNGTDELSFNGNPVQIAGDFLTALTGEVTAVGPGSAAATIALNAVTDAKIRQSAGLSIIGNPTNTLANVADITASTNFGALVRNGASLVFSLLNNSNIDPAAAIQYSKLVLTGQITDADLAGGIAFTKLQSLASGNVLLGNAGGVATATPLTGDIAITNTGLTSVGTNKITDAMLAQIATGSIKGRLTAGTGNVESLSATQVTSILNSFVGDSGAGGTKGLVPAPATGDGAASKVLRADGTWGAAGTASPLTTKGDVYTYSTINDRLPVGTDYQALLADSTTATGLRWANRYQGPKNYVRYANFENNSTTGWSLGTVTLTSALPTGVPTFGSGASGNLALTTTASGPLSGTYSLSLASSAATTAGNFLASEALTLDKAGQAKVLNFSFNYTPSVNPGNANWSATSSNSFGVAIYDVTNAAWIIPSGVFNLGQNSGIGVCSGTFQTPINMTSFRVVLYNANATAGAITLLLDDFYIGLNNESGAAIANGAVSAKYFLSADYAVGANAAVNFDLKSYDTAGAVTTGAAGAWKFTAPTTGIYNVFYTVASTTSVTSAQLFKNGAAVQYLGQLTNTATNSGAASVQLNAGDYISLNSVGATTIQAASGGVKLSAITVTRAPDSGIVPDTRLIVTTVSGAIASTTAGNILKFPTIQMDLTGSYNATTGRYTVPTTGIYRIFGHMDGGINGVSFIVWKNGVTTGRYAGITNSGGDGEYHAIVQANAGDLLDLRADTTADFSGVSNINFEKLSGPSVATPAESVNMKYTTTTSAVATTLGIVKYTVKEADTHNAYSSSTGLYTVPISGMYRVQGAFGVNSSSTAVGSGLYCTLVKNGVNTHNLSLYFFPVTGATLSIALNGSTTIRCLAGDTLNIGVLKDAQLNTTSIDAGSAPWAYMSIDRIGN
jgi:hypothetical protein